MFLSNVWHGRSALYTSVRFLWHLSTFTSVYNLYLFLNFYIHFVKINDTKERKHEVQIYWSLVLKSMEKYSKMEQKSIVMSCAIKLNYIPQHLK